jgi:hypothetical protein
LVEGFAEDEEKGDGMSQLQTLGFVQPLSSRHDAPGEPGKEHAPLR